MNTHRKVIAIVGPTASGKTCLGIQLAKKFNGEVISADSRQVYRGLDIGTGKVTKEEMQGVPHHMLDIADPDETYTVADFVRDSRRAVDDIVSRNKLPIIVGGTFFYMDALLGRIVAPEVLPNRELRKKLESLDIDTLYSMLKDKDRRRAETIDKYNKRRLVRALEIVESLGAVPLPASEKPYDVLLLGISVTKEELEKNIRERLMKRLDAGMIEEVEMLHKAGLSFERLRELGIEYQCIADYLDSKCTREETFRLIETKSYRYAKRQMTWLKRDKDIVWVTKDRIEEIEKRIKNFLTDIDVVE